MSAFRSACFIYPDDGDGSRYDRMFPPLGLELVAASVREVVPKRFLIDLRFDRDWERLIPPDTDIVALSFLWDMPLPRVFAMMRAIRARLPGVTVVAGGRFAETHREELASAPSGARVDVVFSGPDDGRFRAFVEGSCVDRVPGVSFFRDGGFRATPMPPYGPIPDYPLPDRSLRRARYGAIRRDGLFLGIHTDTIQSSRGCPFHCAFCTFNRDAKGRQIAYTARSAKSVADELEQIDAPFVTFVDDLAFHRPDRMDELCEVLLERRIRKTYAIETRINMGMRPDVVEKMARAGFRYVTFGIESMHDHVLVFLDKGLNRRTIEKAFARIGHLPMFFVANFIIGNVGETREEMLRIPEFARRIGLDSIMIHPLRCRGPEPLTAKVLAAPGYHIDPGTRRVYSDALSVADILAIERKIKREFWTPRQILRSAWKFNRLVRPGLLSMAWNGISWRARGRPDPWTSHDRATRARADRYRSSGGTDGGRPDAGLGAMPGQAV
ncbi:MAG: radical SAM protein [Burkholderiales bacterium]|nr:radical SAM protein [Burkholderiales bacterium]